jgi:murein DD-endopeptidase MepM/ murein hydrolase activator NlpD
MTEAKKMIPTPDIRNSPDPDISGSYNAMIRSGQAAIDLAIQTNTAIITSVDGKVVRIPASELIKRSLNTKKLA